ISYAVSMLLSYYIGQKKYPINYPIKEIMAYVLLALVLFAGMTASNELLPLWAALIANTLLGCVYVAYLFKHDFSPSSLPVVGKYFKAGKR
ncbi:MAG: lipopolysaccharide biosynthesis protein, partial [Prevotella sp.]|nr:lipopolysaccharide biosynthesis protein [Prevotella sp.]